MPCRNGLQSWTVAAVALYIQPSCGLFFCLFDTQPSEKQTLMRSTSDFFGIFVGSSSQFQLGVSRLPWFRFFYSFAHTLHRPQITGEILKHVYEFEGTRKLSEAATFLHASSRTSGCLDTSQIEVVGKYQAV